MAHPSASTLSGKRRGDRTDKRSFPLAARVCARGMGRRPGWNGLGAMRARPECRRQAATAQTFPRRHGWACHGGGGLVRAGRGQSLPRLKTEEDRTGDDRTRISGVGIPEGIPCGIGGIPPVDRGIVVESVPPKPDEIESVESLDSGPLVAHGQRALRPPGFAARFPRPSSPS